MKEEILRAIAYFKHKIEYESVFLFDNEITNFETAVKILQEQLDRLEGCEVCNSDDKCNYCQGAIFAGHGECCCIDYEEFESNYYCDVCGRKLRGGEDE